MKDNLARKPALRIIPGSTPGKLPDVASIAPDISNSVDDAGKRSSPWLSSLLIVVLAYAAPLVWWFMPQQTPGVSAPPPAAMVVELAPAPVAPASQPDMPPGPEQAETPPPKPEPKPEPEPPPPPPEVKPEVALKPKPEPVAEPVEELEETPLEDEPQSVASAPADAPQEDDIAAAPNQGVSVPTVNANAIPTWQNSLMLKLNEAKRYPTRARRSRQEGVSYLRFTMDRDGNVLAKSLERSAGYALLDEETLALIDRAQPLPKPPPEMKGEQLEFVVPVEFFLNR